MFYFSKGKLFVIAGKGNFVLKRMNLLGKKADTFGHVVGEHGMKHSHAISYINLS